VCLHEISAECGNIFRTKSLQSGTETRESRPRFRNLRPLLSEGGHLSG
jgi:hypothetical protein